MKTIVRVLGAALLLAGLMPVLPSLVASSPKAPAATPPDRGRRPSAAALARIKATERERVDAALTRVREHFAGKPIGVKVGSVVTDGFGRTHVGIELTVINSRIQPQLPVRGVSVVAHVDVDEAITLDAFDPNELPGEIHLPIAESRAVAIATGDGSTLRSIELQIRPRRFDFVSRLVRSTAADFALVYVAQTARGRDPRAVPTEVVIDGDDGTVLSRHSERISEPVPPRSSAFNAVPKHLLPPAAPSARPRAQSVEFGIGESHYSGHVILKTDFTDGVYTLCNPEQGIGGPTCVYAGTDVNHQPTGGEYYRSVDNYWGDGQALPQGADPMSATGETAAVDAFSGVMWMWEMLRVLGIPQGPRRDGGPIDIEVHAHVTPDINQCSPWTYDKTIFFPSRCAEYGPWEMPDVVGHEMAHIFYRARAYGNHRISLDESGATIEATADILGEMAEFYQHGIRGADPTRIPDRGGDWILGGGFREESIRNFFKPSLHGGLDLVPPGTLPGALRGNPHLLGGVLTRAFYFLSQGARPYVAGDPASEMYGSHLTPTGFPGLGNDKATRLWVDAMPYFLRGWFVDVRTAMLVTAFKNHDLGPEYAAVENAFAAVGVGSPDDVVAPRVQITAVQMPRVRKVEINVSFEDEDTGIRVAGVTLPGGVRILSEGSHEFKVPVGSGPNELRTGTYTFFAMAYDHAGHKGEASVTLFVDADGPVTTIRDSTQNDRSLVRRFTTAALDPAGVTKIELHVDQRRIATREDDPYEFDGVDLARFGSGQHVVEAVAYDPWGNTGRAGTTITMDNAAGACSFGNISSARFPEVRIALRHHDTSGGTVLFNAYVDHYGEVWSGEVPYNYAPNQAYESISLTHLPRGQHRAELKCTDRWGNVSFAYPATFTVTSKPTVTLNARAEHEHIVFDYVAADDLGLKELDVFLDNYSEPSIRWSDGPVLESGTVRIENKPVGSHRVCIQARDIHLYRSEEICQDVVTMPRPTPTPMRPTPQPDTTFNEVEPNFNHGANGWRFNEVPANVTVIRGVITGPYGTDNSDFFRIRVNDNDWVYVSGSDHNNPCYGDFDLDIIAPQTGNPYTITSGEFGNYHGDRGEASMTGDTNNTALITVLDPGWAQCYPYRYELRIRRR